MNELTTFATFEEYRGVLTHELEQASESFVRIGYLLKVARDTAILSGTPYKDVNEFAAAEYNLDKTQVSRFIRINDRFSEGGNSSRLQESFRGIGYAKLSMMLLLPDSLNEEITPTFSKSEVQALKEEVQAEEEVTPIERMLEGEKPELEDMSLLEKAAYEMLRANPEIYEKVWELCNVDPPHLDQAEGEEAMTKRLQEILAPAGEQIYSVRIQGVGRIAVSIKGTDRDIMLVNLRSDEKEAYGWFYLIQAMIRLSVLSESAGTAYEAVFRESFPDAQTEKVAPVQPEKRKESKVRKAEPDKKPAPARPKIEPVKPEPEPEEPKEADSGSETVQKPDIPEAVEKTAKSTEAAVKAWKDMAQSTDAAAEGVQTLAAAARQAVDGEAGAAVAPMEAEGASAAEQECEGQTSFEDFPDILPAPERKCSEQAMERLILAVHNFAVEARHIAEEDGMSAEDLEAILKDLWREEWY